MLGGDQDLPVENYRRHYRIRHPVVPDNMDRWRHLIRTEGIASVAVFGGDGTCVLNQPAIGADTAAFRKVLDGALAACKGANRMKSAFRDGGTSYPPDVAEQGRIVRERWPAVAADPGSGDVYLAWSSDESGTDDVFLRIRGKDGPGKPIPVAATDRIEYAPAVAVTAAGEALVAYVAEDEQGRFDVWCAPVKGGKAGKPVRITKSPDDAMGPALASGPDGTWLVWYEWRLMDGLSRDREVFAAKFSGGRFGDPVQVSPKDVPIYEDHADPSVCGDGKGGAFVAWAWDYHGTLGAKPPVDENSVFLRHLDPRGTPGPVLAAGWRGEGRARDYAPSTALGPGGIPFVAWDNSHKSSLGDGAKAVFVNRLEGPDFGPQTEVAANAGPIDSPRVLSAPDGSVHAVWGQQSANGWAVFTRRLAPGEPAEPQRVMRKTKSPRWPSACFDAKGAMWIACAETEDRAFRVALEKAE